MGNENTVINVTNAVNQVYANVFLRRKLPVRLPRPATKPPIKPVSTIIKMGLSVLINNIDILWASK